MAAKFKIKVFWFVMPCSVVVGISISEVHADSHFTLMMEKAWSSKTFVSVTTLHDITTQKTLT
jgi:hypothetical protein